MTDPSSAMGSDVGDKLIAIHEALDAAGIGHAFGGAIALAYAVPEPRATIDIDINIAIPVDRAARVIEALPDGLVVRAIWANLPGWSTHSPAALPGSGATPKMPTGGFYADPPAHPLRLCLP